MSEEEIAEEEVPVVPLVSAGMIHGVPIAYIAIWAALIAVASLIPISIVIGGGGSFPASYSLLALVGILLGPVAGAIATTIGVYLGAFIAPYTAGIMFPFGQLGDVLATFAAGLITMKAENKQKERLYLLIAALGVIPIMLMFWSTFFIFNLWCIPPGSEEQFAWIPREYFRTCASPFPDLILVLCFDFLPGLILFLVTMKWVRQWIQSENPFLLAIGVFVISYFVLNTYQHYWGWFWFEIITYYPLPADIAIVMLFTWWERLYFSATAAVIGAAVIIALRKAGIRKPLYAIW